MKCPCGRDLHYHNADSQAMIEKMIAELGETINVTTPAGTWRVPRHYIALHGLRGDEVAGVAKAMGFEKVTDGT